MNKLALTLLTLAVVIGAVVWAVIQIPREEYTSDASLNTSGKYIQALDWPPEIRVNDEPFSCSEAREIEGRAYCVTTSEENSGGSIYTHYTYSTDMNSKTLILTFSTRESQCENYPQEEAIECRAEQEVFNPDPYIHSLVETQENVGTKNLEEAESSELKVTVSPLTIRQGDPALITLEGLGTSTVKTLTFNSKTLPVFEYGVKTRALVGVDLRAPTGSFPLVVILSDGRGVSEKIVVRERTIATAPLGIPEKLGGDTPESEQNLINTLVEEGRLISAVPSSGEKLWEGNFSFPLKGEIIVTDTYGYSRLTGASTISHKGTDFRAKVGTPVYAMNSGVVRFNQFLRNYGNTIIVDHGLGLHTIYMHLSESGVKLGEGVEKGQMIGKSGDTGYVLGPHLHLTIRINGVSIDPEKFMELFGPTS